MSSSQSAHNSSVSTQGDTLGSGPARLCPGSECTAEKSRLPELKSKAATEIMLAASPDSIRDADGGQFGLRRSGRISAEAMWWTGPSATRRTEGADLNNTTATASD